jgi:hypothetical protein
MYRMGQPSTPPPPGGARKAVREEKQQALRDGRKAQKAKREALRDGCWHTAALTGSSQRGHSVPQPRISYQNARERCGNSPENAGKIVTGNQESKTPKAKTSPTHACGHSHRLHRIQHPDTCGTENLLWAHHDRARAASAQPQPTGRTPGPSAPSSLPWPPGQHPVPVDHHRNASKPCPDRAVGALGPTPPTVTPGRLAVHDLPHPCPNKNERSRGGARCGAVGQKQNFCSCCCSWIQNVLQEVKSVIWLRRGASDNFVRLLPGPIFIWLRGSLITPTLIYRFYL